MSEGLSNPLLDALGRVRASLERGEFNAAASAIDALGDPQAWPDLDARALRACQALRSACVTLAERRRAVLAQELRQASGGRRAQAAYRAETALRP